MKLIKTVLAFTCLMSLSAVANTDAEKIETEKEFSSAMKKTLEDKGAVEGMQSLPVTSIQFVTTEEGESYAVSSSGRFIFIGQVIDLWKKKEIKTLKDAMDTKKLPLEMVGYDRNNLSVFSFGNKNIEKQGVIFATPNCPFCKKLLTYINDNPEDYHFDVVITPFTKNSAPEARRLWCAVDREAAKQDFVHGTNNAIEQKPDCDWKKVIAAGALFKMTLDGKGVPTIYRNDGLKKEGIRPSKSVEEQLDDFLARS